jgi:thiol-disulfide isomerase/thioredoxin
MTGRSILRRPVDDLDRRRVEISGASAGLRSDRHRPPRGGGASRSLVAALVAVLVLAAGGATAGSPPDFRLKDLDGNWLSLSEHLGEGVVYITFWATWCVPCRREIPHLQALYEEFGDRGLQIISVNTDPPATESKIKPYVKRYGIGYTTVLDPNNNVLDKYNPTRELPYAVLVDRLGNVHQIFPGYRGGDEKVLRQKIIELLDLGDAAGGEAATGEPE